MTYGSWDMECDRQIFLSFCTVDTENQNFKKMKKTRQDIIILQMCTISDSDKMYGSWDTECKGQNFLSFWTVFLPFYHPLFKTQKIKILKN